jgi:2-amino-4-hydroxy-6-hydroxymethyldihydropteridine diphosphokinase
MESKVFLGLGSNRDNRLWYIFRTLRYLAKIPMIRIENISSIYETEPYGVIDQRDFLNAVVEIATGFTPGHLLQCIKFIEKKVGRIERGFWAPREIDVDILVFADKDIALPWLTIPHVEIHKRRFVLIPFAEIAPELKMPRYNRSVESLLKDCLDQGRVRLHIPKEEVSGIHYGGEEHLKALKTQVGIYN